MLRTHLADRHRRGKSMVNKKIKAFFLFGWSFETREIGEWHFHISGKRKNHERGVFGFPM